MNQKCYFKKLVESSSKEAQHYQRQFPEIDFKKCLYKCTGYQGYGTCDSFTVNFEKGLINKIK